MKNISLALVATVTFSFATLSSSHSNASTSVDCEATVVAIVKVKPGSEDAFKTHAQSILEPTRQEPGSVTYRFQQSVADATIFTTYELWENAANLEAHLATTHMQDFFGKVGPLFEAGYPIIHVMQNIECQK